MGTTLKSDIAAKLADLLAELPQTRGHLRDCDGYCIEGTLCELYRRETGNGEWVNDGDAYGMRFADGGPEMVSDAAPLRVLKWASSAGEFRVVTPDRNADALELNDKGWTFADFACELRDA